MNDLETAGRRAVEQAGSRTPPVSTVFATARARRRRRWTTLAGAAAVLAVVASVTVLGDLVGRTGAEPTPAVTDTSRSGPDGVDVDLMQTLGRSDWTSTEVVSEGRSLDHEPWKLAFFDGGLYVGGCNGFSWNQVVVDRHRVLHTSGDRSTTQKGCFGDDADEPVADLLTGRPTVSLAGDVLTLASDRTTATFAPSPSTRAGVAAAWRLDDRFPVRATDTEVRIIVTRPPCSTNARGDVMPASVVFSEDSVIIGTRVEKPDLTVPQTADCPGPHELPVTVELHQAIGDRVLVASECLPDGALASTQACSDGPVRGRP